MLLSPVEVDFPDPSPGPLGLCSPGVEMLAAAALGEREALSSACVASGHTLGSRALMCVPVWGPPRDKPLSTSTLKAQGLCHTPGGGLQPSQDPSL